MENAADPLGVLQTLLNRYHAQHASGLPRFCGGAVGYLSYDAVRYTENLPNAPPDDRGLPDVAFDFYDAMVIFDHIQKTIAVVAHAHVPESLGKGPGCASPGQLRAAYDAACRRVDELVDRLENTPVTLPLADIEADGAVERVYRSNFQRSQFEDAVRRCKEYIRAGDIFQVVLSQRLQAETRARPFDINLDIFKASFDSLFRCVFGSYSCRERRRFL